MAIVLYGSHGGELDRETVIDPNGERSIRQAISRLIERCVLYPGDKIVIETT